MGKRNNKKLIAVLVTLLVVGAISVFVTACGDSEKNNQNVLADILYTLYKDYLSSL